MTKRIVIMSKKINKFFISVFVVISFVLVLFVPNFSFDGFANASSSIKDANVVYNSVDKTIVVSEEKVLNITERITVTFKNPGINVGLSRNISKVNKITRFYNGKEYVNTTVNKLELLSVILDGEEEYNFVEQDSEYYYINTGADGDYKTGTHTYEINYLYDMGEDFISDFDDVTFDLMDYGFASNVENFSAQITLPKEFLFEGQNIEDVLSFRTNEMQNVGFDGVNFRMEGNTISCSVSDLGSYTGLTMQLILPNKYFNTSYSPSAVYWLVFASCFLALIAVAVLILINRRKLKNIVITPEFYPPKDYSPLDIARAYRGKLKSNDFASLVIYWAGKGYVSIKNENEKITLTKLKDIPNVDNNNPLFASKKAEINYFNGLFAQGESITLPTNNTASLSLKNSVRNLYQIEKEKESKIYPFKIAINIIVILPLLFFMLWNMSLGLVSSSMFMMLLFPVIAVFAFFYFDGPIFFMAVWSIFFGGIPLFMLASTLVSVYDICGVLYISLIVFLLGSFSVLFLKAYSEQELKDMGKILGFKNFLVTAELDRLEMLVEENPNYYYDILPFCYVFGITDKIEEKFASLKVENPEFYAGSSAVAFGIILSHSMRNVSYGISMYSGNGSGMGIGGFGGGRGGSSGGGGGGGGSHGR